MTVGRAQDLEDVPTIVFKSLPAPSLSLPPFLVLRRPLSLNEDPASAIPRTRNECNGDRSEFLQTFVVSAICVVSLLQQCRKGKYSSAEKTERIKEVKQASISIQLSIKFSAHVFPRECDKAAGGLPCLCIKTDHLIIFVSILFKNCRYKTKGNIYMNFTEGEQTGINKRLFNRKFQNLKNIDQLFNFSIHFTLD